jgi:hypothetical protein
MKLRIAFLGSRKFELQVPAEDDSGETSFFAVAEDSRPSIADAHRFGPDVTFVFDPFSFHGSELDSVPGIKIGVVNKQPSPGELNEAVRRHRAGLRVFDWFTWFKEPPSQASDLPFLAVVGAVVDTRRLPDPPALERVEVAVPTWARPPDESISAEFLPANTDPLQLREVLSRHGILLYYSKEPLELSDPALVLALGHGQLVISNQAFPAQCGLEEEDEYLVRPVKEWPELISKEREGVGYFRAVRVRAWQKVRELFDASRVFRRLATDARLLVARRG